jgi:predicted transposase/invertase (TIGR01784 family)
MGIEELLLDQAKKEGRQEGNHEKAVAIARELKKEGLSVDFIAKTTKLSVEEIGKL